MPYSPSGPFFSNDKKMDERIMETKEDKKATFISEIMILIFAILCIALIVADLSSNLSEVVHKRREHVEIEADSKESTPNADFPVEELQEFLGKRD